MAKMKMHWMEAEELAGAMLGMDDEADSDAIEQALADKFDISFDAFHKIAEALLPFNDGFGPMWPGKETK